jgi:hypothetical protein
MIEDAPPLIRAIMATIRAGLDGQYVLLTASSAPHSEAWFKAVPMDRKSGEEALAWLLSATSSLTLGKLPSERIKEIRADHCPMTLSGDAMFVIAKYLDERLGRQ